jgi:hypothetical protein
MEGYRFWMGKMQLHKGSPSRLFDRPIGLHQGRAIAKNSYLTGFCGILLQGFEQYLWRNTRRIAHGHR